MSYSLPTQISREPEIYAGFFEEADARRCLRHNPGMDVMKHLGNGVLTTEY